MLWQVQGQSGAQYGWAISELADIDDDGSMDVLVGAPRHDEGDGSGGLLEVLSGRTGEVLFRFVGQAGERLGHAMADAGDVDGDGLHDILVGAPGSADTGRAYVYSGASGTVLHTLEGESVGDEYGFAVASAGDLDGDGLADVLVTAQGVDENRGRAYVMAGAHGSVLRTFDGPDPAGRFGSGTGYIGDLDGDGIADPCVGARDAGPEQRGRVLAFSGVDGSPLFAFGGGADSQDVGWFFVAKAGDLDADGTSDLYVGDFTATTAGSNTGRIHVFSGADQSSLLEVEGDGPNQGLGPGRFAGDVDHDGVPDVVAGSYLSSDGAEKAGKIQIFSGLDGDVLRTIVSTEAGEKLGFDAVGVGDVDGGGTPDLLAAAATGSRVYLIAGEQGSGPGDDTGGTGSTAPRFRRRSQGHQHQDAAAEDDGQGTGGCTCQTGRSRSGASFLLLLGLIVVARRLLPAQRSGVRTTRCPIPHSQRLWRRS